MDAYTLALREFNALIIKGIIPERLKDRANSAGGGTLTGEHKRNPGRNQHSTNDSGYNRRFSMRHWKKTCCSGTSGVMNRIKRSAYLTFLMEAHRIRIPRKSTRLWNTASDKERAEAFSLVRSKKGQVRRSPLHRNKLAVVVRVSSYDGDPEELYFDNV
jgi:hypothetical protein